MSDVDVVVVREPTTRVAVQEQAPDRVTVSEILGTPQSGLRFNGDDVTEDLQTAILDYQAAGRVLDLPAGVGGISDTLVADPDGGPVMIRGAGKGMTILEHGVVDNPMFQLNGPGATLGATTLCELTEDAAIDTAVLTVDDTSACQAGQLVLLRDVTGEVLGDSDDGGSHHVRVARPGEFVRIRSVDDAVTLTLDGRLNWPLPTGSDVRTLPTLDHTTLSDFTILEPDPLGNTSSAARGIVALYNYKLSVARVSFEALDGPAVYMLFGTDWRVTDCDFDMLREDTTNAYGVVSGRATQHGIMDGCLGRHGRHLFTTLGNSAEVCPQHILVANCLAAEQHYTAFDSHAGSRFITFADCEVHNGGDGINSSGFHFRGPDGVCQNPIVRGASQDGVAFIDGADRGLLSGGVLENCDHAVRINDSDDITLDGGTQMRNPITNGVLVDAQTPAWAGHMTKQNFRDFVITGDPSDYAIRQGTANAGCRIGPAVSIPDATRKVIGVNSVPTRTAAATTPEPGS